MKKAKKVLLMLMSAILMIECCGCGIFISERKLKRLLENALEEKYDEEFECFDVWSNRGDSYWGVCAPEKNHDIRFEALFLSDGKISEITYEGYYAACVAEQIEEDVQNELENVFDDFYLHSYMTVPLVSYETNDIYAENVRNQSFDIDEYVSLVKEKREGRTSITLIILINSEKNSILSYEEEYQTMSDFCKNIKAHNLNPAVFLKFIPEDKYLECIKYVKTKSSTNDTFEDMLRDYPVQVNDTNMGIRFEFEGDTHTTITLEEYINQRKEVN